MQKRKEIDSEPAVSFADDNMSYSSASAGDVLLTDSITTTAAIDYTYPYTVSITNSDLSVFPSAGIYGESLSPTVIKTRNGSVNMDELADLIEVIKKRLLILTPNFEMHERYPLLKQLYDEYVALERLLSGPDNQDDQ